MIAYAGFVHGITDWFSHSIWGEPLAPESPLRGRGEAAP